MIQSKADKMVVGQVWESNDPRDTIRLKRVMRVDGATAYLAPVGGGRLVKVQCDKFLKRQGTKSGYSLYS